MLVLQFNPIFVYHSQLHNNKNRKIIYFLVYWYHRARCETHTYSNYWNSETRKLNLYWRNNF